VSRAVVADHPQWLLVFPCRRCKILCFLPDISDDSLIGSLLGPELCLIPTFSTFSSFVSLILSLAWWGQYMFLHWFWLRRAKSCCDWRGCCCHECLASNLVDSIGLLCLVLRPVCPLLGLLEWPEGLLWNKVKITKVSKFIRIFITPLVNT